MINSLLRYRALAWVWVSIVALAATGHAGTIDPQMGMTDAGDSNAFTQGVMFGPDANGGGVISFYNATGATIVSVTFATTLNISPGLQPTFSCNNAFNSLLPNPFFENCSADYNPSTEYLQFVFYGTSQSGGDSDPFCGRRPGTLDEGIPPGTDFLITFNYNFSLKIDAGGWNAVGSPTFTAIDVQTDPTPEPSPALLAGVGLIAGAVLLLLRARRMHRRLATSVAGRPSD